ncbi:thiol-disulfide isomerase/thioredoxin [Endobacter medicaginis]|uniref:Thiol-disulfide isomerase/thioredoxin n=2 Tax=Endobacter medicaginis TaxID=1181271 RepID=A0A839V250_9PROT|nr:thioredoxin family protein [Endobacter medicaginis]MBB3174584.1 thiol-disulfide isomerase/thioredoxin [Endobacter medicaginis]MCX5474724.1 thioredoxin family protein [Endobacter medicaginis]
MRLAAASIIAFGLAAAPAARAAVTAPQVPAGQSKPVTAPYDTTADAHKAVDTAFARAKAEHKTVLIDFGGNWCPDCRILAGVMANPALAPWIEQHFVVVKVDVGRYDRNMDLEAKYGGAAKGVPAVIAVTPEGKILNPDDTRALADARSMSDQAVADKLAGWAPG